MRWIRIAYSPRLLKDIFKKGIRRPKLHTLSIYIKYGEHESVLRSIFLLYPCIKHLTFKLISGRSKFRDPFAMKLGLNPDTQLESLALIILTRKDYDMGTLVDQTEQGLRLKYLETRLMKRRPSPSLENKIFDFFRSQRNLEVIKLTTTIASKKLFYNILESCPKLQEFHLDTSMTCMNLKPSEMPRFIASISKLKCLELGFKLDDISEEVPSFSDLLPNTVQLNLTYLDWKYSCVYSSDFRVAFLQRCSSLKHLRLEECCDTTLQIIFQHLMKLQTLVVDDLKHCTNFGFFGLAEDRNEDGYSIKRLQHLKHLELHCSSIVLTERTALELQLPRLEFLNLHSQWFDQLSEEALNHLASHLPKLRVLAIDPQFETDSNIEKTIQFCRQLNNLHNLIFHWYFTVYGDILKKNVESIFSACPSLRYISDRMRHAFMRDPFTRKILFEGCQKSFKHVFRSPYW